MDDELADELDRMEHDDPEASLDGTALEVSLGSMELEPPVLVERHEPIHELVHKMKNHGTNSVLVVDDEGRLVGIFTERDLLARVVGRPVDWFTTTVEEVMTRDPECLHAHDPLTYALNFMHVGSFGHVPVVDENRRPIALVTLKDVVHYLAEAFPEQLSNLPPDPEHEPHDRYGA